MIFWKQMVWEQGFKQEMALLPRGGWSQVSCGWRPREHFARGFLSSSGVTPVGSVKYGLPDTAEAGSFAVLRT